MVAFLESPIRYRLDRLGFLKRLPRIRSLQIYRLRCSETYFNMEGISERSHKLLKGPLSYIDVFIQAMPDLW